MSCGMLGYKPTTSTLHKIISGKFGKEELANRYDLIFSKAGIGSTIHP